MGANYSHTTRSTGTVLTDTIYNADHNNHITNMIPTIIDDYSANAATMQTTRDPYPGASVSLATSLAEELSGIRYIIKQITGAAQWYIDPTGLDSAIVSSSLTAVGTIATGVWQGTAVDGTYIDLEGTELKSTGEAVDTKYLRTDGDGTCSWQVISGAVTSVSGATGAVADSDIDHDQLANFAANEHYTQANITATGTVASGVWQGTAIDGTYIDLEGTEVKSTGEAGGTKYLKEDGDGTSSWQSAPAPEGTAVLSTGEAGGTKFLREDGDGSCSWQTGSGGGSYDSIGTNDILITKITIDENITFGGTDNGLSIGPLSIANGYTVSVVNGTRWLVL